MRKAWRMVYLVLAPAILAGCGLGSGRPELPENPVARHEALLNQAWGPESAQDLQKYLDLRRELKDTYDQFQDGIQQWSLREAGTAPLFGPAVLGVMNLRRRLDELLPKYGLTFEDYQRLTFLVYGRWVRAVADDPPPERRILRSLREMEIGVERTLAHNPPENETERLALENRLASIRHQARCVEPFGRMDKAATLERIDPETRVWMDEHREEIQKLSFGYFDTAAPPREETAAPR